MIWLSWLSPGSFVLISLWLTGTIFSAPIAPLQRVSPSVTGPGIDESGLDDHAVLLLDKVALEPIACTKADGLAYGGEVNAKEMQDGGQTAQGSATDYALAREATL